MVAQLLGPLLGAGVSAFGIAKQSQAQDMANALQWRAIQEQQRANRKQEQLQRATRTDAYGNSVEYVPGQGFVTRTTPITGSILNAEQKEALENLTVDAPRQREARRRQDRRSTQADGLFQDQFANFRYERAPNRKESEARALRDALMARNERMRGGSGDTGQQLANAAVRMGSSSAAQALARGLQSRNSDLPTVSQTISDARRLGRNDYQEDLQSRAGVLAELDQIRAMADASPSVGINNTNLNESLTGRQEGAINQLSDVIGRGGQALAGQFNNASATAGRGFPDVSGLASALGRINFGSGQQQQQADPNADFQRSLAQDAFRAGLRGMDSGQAMNAFRAVRGTF